MEPKYCSTDLHYNQTFVLEKYQSSETVLQSILDSKCSPELAKYLCYTTVPPCKPNDLSVFIPCRSICEQVGLHFVSFNTFITELTPKKMPFLTVKSVLGCHDAKWAFLLLKKLFFTEYRRYAKPTIVWIDLS